jgi:uncharacterized damage-inducible protein DinB
MPMNQALIEEFQQEMAHTRRCIERIPQDKWDWKPHQKSWKMGDLATHIANITGWMAININTDAMDLAPPGGEPMKPTLTSTVQETLELFDKGVADGKSALASTTDEHLLDSWALLRGGVQLYSAPRIEDIRYNILNHHIHHRAQLCVYLRLCDVPVPAIYGSSADEDEILE